MLITVAHGGPWGEEAQRAGLRRDTGGFQDLPEFLGSSTSWARDRNKPTRALPSCSPAPKRKTTLENTRAQTSARLARGRTPGARGVCSQDPSIAAPMLPSVWAPCRSLLMNSDHH